MCSYRELTHLISPLIPLWLRFRVWQGKEDPQRISERFGQAGQPRPEGTLLWLHAASIGEANSVLLLIQQIRAQFPQVHMLLTTGTVTSAKLMQARLPKEVIHHYVPIDTPNAVDRFMRHWRPDIGLWVESELWPNLVQGADEWQCFMGLINARMSERSFNGWKRHPKLIGRMLSRFNLVLAQSEEDAARLEGLGAKDVLCLGNLKYDAALLPCDEGELVHLRDTIGGRPVWLAASTHPGEEAMIAQAHKLLAATRSNLLTVIVPRHPERGATIADELKKIRRVALRSRGEEITPDTSFYIADTLGELGLFYRLCTIVFMGGSLVAHGGQNPLEPARLSCAVISGPHTHNFAAVYQEMETLGACRRIENLQQLAAQIDQLFNQPAMRDLMQNLACQWIANKGGAATRVLDMLTPIFTARKKAA